MIMPDDLGRLNRSISGLGGGATRSWETTPDPEPGFWDLSGRLRAAWGKVRAILVTFREVFSRLQGAGAKLRGLMERARAIQDPALRSSILFRLSGLLGRQETLEREAGKIENRVEDLRRKVQVQEEILHEGISDAMLGGLGLIFTTGILVVMGIAAAATATVAAAIAWIKSSEKQIKAIEMEVQTLDMIESGDLTPEKAKQISLARAGAWMGNFPGAIKWIAIAGIVITGARLVGPYLRQGK